MCRLGRVPLVLVAGINNERGYYEVNPPKATGVFTPWCYEHRCQVDIVFKEYTSEEHWICPGRPDELSRDGKAEIELEGK